MSADAFAEIAQEVDGVAGDFFLAVGSFEGGAVLDVVDHFAEAFDAAGGEGVDGARADGVDADAFGAEVYGEVADGGFEGGFGDAHDVVVTDGAGAAEVAHGADAGVFVEEGFEGAAELDEGVAGDIECGEEAVGAGFDKASGEVFALGEGGAVDEEVDFAVGGFDVFDELFDLGFVGEIHLERAHVGAAFDEVADFFADAFGLDADPDLSSVLGSEFGDGPPDAIFVCDVEDEPFFAFQEHGIILLRRFGGGGAWARIGAW